MIERKEAKLTKKDYCSQRNYALSLAGQIGYTIATPLIIFMLAGIFVDNQLHTKPMFTLIGLVVGMILSFYSLYQLLKPFLKKK